MKIKLNVRFKNVDIEIEDIEPIHAVEELNKCVKHIKMKMLDDGCLEQISPVV